MTSLLARSMLICKGNNSLAVLFPRTWQSAVRSISTLQRGDTRPHEEILSHFHAPIKFAVAYGSAVMPQSSDRSEQKNNMVDYIFGVTYPDHWHAINLKQHPAHYSAYSLFGTKSISWLQERGAGVYYNTHVRVGGQLIKYGVVSTHTLEKELTEWHNLYLSGRMQKPILVIRDDARLNLANQINRLNAVRAALLMLPQDFTERELFLTIAQLSYKGDFRMTYGENPMKVENIVDNQLDLFREDYAEILDALPNVRYIRRNTLRQNNSDEAKGIVFNSLPATVVDRVRKKYQRKTGTVLTKPTDPVEDRRKEAEVIATDPEFQPFLAGAIRDVVALPALIQSLKGIVTAGPFKSIRYSAEKLRKRREALKKMENQDQ